MAANNPNYQSQAYTRQMPDLKIVSDCYRGTRAIRDAGNEYLPKEPAEKLKPYQIRLSRAVFWNAYRRTVQGFAGMVFRRNPELKDVPSEIVSELENVDLQGTHFDVFAKQIFTSAVNDGHTFIFVEMAQKQEKSQISLSPVPTSADDKFSARRPYWLHCTKDQIINWRTEVVNGRVVLTQATIEECLLEPDGDYGEKQVKQYRVLKRGSYTIFRKGDGDSWAVYEQNETSLSEIPLVPVYSSRCGFFESDPPLLGVAHENLRHYRLQSDLDHILHVANVPILTRVGGDQTKPLVVGAGYIVDVPAGAELKYVEHEGKAIGKAQEERDKCKENIAALALASLASTPSVKQTATESVLDYEAETSELASMARALEDGLEQALVYHAMYKGLSAAGEIEVNDDFATRGMDAQKIAALWAVAKEGGWSYETFWSMLERAEELPDNFNAVTERERLKDPLKDIQLERARLNLQADKQALTGDPAAIQQRIIEKANGQQTSVS